MVQDDRRLFVLPLVLVALLVPAILPPPGRYDVEWLVGLAVVYCELAVVLALVTWATRSKTVARLSTPGGLLLGLAVALGTQASITTFEFTFVPVLMRFEGAPMPTFAEAIAGAILFGFVEFGVWVLVVRYPELVARDAARRAEAARLRALADQEQIRARLAPHFLLNTLNAVAGLVGEDPAGARRVLAALGDLLRVALNNDPEVQHAVRDEFDLLQSYACILQTRYGEDRLCFEWSLDEDVASCKLPCLLLQPLVENAVLHGALESPEPSTVRIAASRDISGGLRVVIENDGGFEPEATRRRHGVSLVEQRIELLRDGGFELTSRDGRTRAIVSLPTASS